MLNRFSIKQRIYLIVFLFFTLFVSMIWFAISNSNNVREFAISDTADIMLKDQKAKLKVATHSIALAIGQNIKDIDESVDLVEGGKLASNQRFY